MKLQHLGQVSNNSLLILHGLFGNKTNFSSILKYLVKKGINSVAVDLRNHGDSPWCESSKIKDMAKDIKDFIQEEKIEKVNVLGHSLGGKVGMKLALEYPNLVNSLIVVDMSPFSKRNPLEMLTFVKEMKKAQDRFTKKEDIKLALKEVVKDPMVLEFLMTNLIKKNDSWKFRINLDVLEKDIPSMLQEEIANSTRDQAYNKNTLFIGGSRADYIKEHEHERIKRVFTRAEFRYLDAGHWVHFEKPREFLDLVTGFLKDTDQTKG